MLSSRNHFGPLTVQKPFYPEPSVCHTYLLHPPGGIVPGDHLSLQVNLEKGAEALLTTPAAGKFYRCDQRHSSLVQQLNLKDGASLEWLPQETIAFAGCDSEIVTRVELGYDARLFAWDMVCLGRPASGERFSHGRLRQRFEIWRQGRPLLLERALYSGGSDALNRCWGMQGYAVTGTLIANHADETVLQRVRGMSSVDAECTLAVTLIDEILVCRCLAKNAETARNAFIRIWSELRPRLLKREAIEPRIWNT